MVSLQFEINRFGVGDQQIALQQFPSQRKRVEDSLTNHFFKRPDIQAHLAQQKGKFDFNFTLKRKTFAVQTPEGVQEFPLGKADAPELKKIGRVVQFYQHAGKLSRRPLSKGEAQVHKRASWASVEMIRKSAVPGATGKLISATRVTEGTLQLGRDVLSTLPDFGPNHWLAQNLAFFVGPIWTGLSIREAAGGVTDLKRARLIEDKEGVNRAQSRIFSGTIGSVASGVFLTGKICETFAVAGAVTGGLSLGANCLFGVGTAFAMGMSALGMYRCHKFQKRLDEYLNAPELTRPQQIESALRFLRDLVIVTPEERTEIEEGIDPNLSDTERERIIQEKIAYRTEAKVKYLKRRSSNFSLQLILEKADPILKKIAVDETREEGLHEAEKLIESVKEDSTHKFKLFLLGFIAATLSFVALILLNVATMGAFPFLLFTVSAVIYLALSGYTMYQQFAKQRDLSLATWDLQPLNGGHPPAI